MNKKLLNYSFILILFEVLSCVSSTDKIEPIAEQPVKYNETTRIYTKIPQDTEQMRFFEYGNNLGNGFLRFNIIRPKLFMLQNSEIPSAYCFIYYREYGNSIENMGNTSINKIRINGILTNFSIENLPPFEIDGQIIRRLKATVGTKEYFFDFIVEVIPVSLGVTYNELIKIMGQPDDEMKGSFDTWKPSETFYNPDLNDRYHSYWTLRYNAYLGYEFGFNEKGILIYFW